MTNFDEEIQNLIKQSTENIEKSKSLSEQINQSIKVIIDCYRNGNKVISKKFNFGSNRQRNIKQSALAGLNLLRMLLLK